MGSGCHFVTWALSQSLSRCTFCVGIVVCANLLLWQPMAKKGRWELFTAHTALTSLLSNPPVVAAMKSWSNPGQVDLHGLRQRFFFLTRLVSNNPTFSSLMLHYLWMTVSRSIPFPVWTGCHSHPGEEKHTELSRECVKLCPVCPLQMSLPQPFQWLSNHITNACLISFCHGWVFLLPPHSHTQTCTQLLAGILERLGLHLKQFTTEIIGLWKDSLYAESSHSICIRVRQI